MLHTPVISVFSPDALAQGNGAPLIENPATWVGSTDKGLSEPFRMCSAFKRVLANRSSFVGPGNEITVHVGTSMSNVD